MRATLVCAACAAALLSLGSASARDVPAAAGPKMFIAAPGREAFVSDLVDKARSGCRADLPALRAASPAMPDAQLLSMCTNKAMKGWAFTYIPGVGDCIRVKVDATGPSVSEMVKVGTALKDTKRYAFSVCIGD